MATQNPIEQEGTYPLPEAQLDRFLMHLRVDFPAKEAEHKILQLVRSETLKPEPPHPSDTLSQNDVFTARKEIVGMHMADSVEEYLVQLIMATRKPQAYSEDIARWIDYGASPRGTIALDLCSRAVAWLDGRDFVSPEDVQAVAHDALRHRLILSFEADAQGILSDQILDDLIRVVPVP